MEIKSASLELQDKIHFLEIQQAYEEQDLREQFNYTYEHLKPVNLLKDSLMKFISAPPLVNTVIGTAMGLASGYLSRIFVVGASGNIIRKFLGLLLQRGVTNAVEQHPDKLKLIGQYIYQYFLSKKGK